MGLETVLEEIVAQGRNEASRILREADEEAQGILSKAGEEAGRVQERWTRETKARVEALERELRGASEFEARRRVLSTQRSLFQDFRTRILEDLSKLPADATGKILDKLVARAKKELPQGTASARKSDMPHLEKAGYKGGATLKGVGGFIIEDAASHVLVDYRYETLVDDMWKSLVGHAKQLIEVES